MFLYLFDTCPFLRFTILPLFLWLQKQLIILIKLVFILFVARRKRTFYFSDVLNFLKLFLIVALLFINLSYDLSYYLLLNIDWHLYDLLEYFHLLLLQIIPYAAWIALILELTTFFLSMDETGRSEVMLYWVLLIEVDWGWNLNNSFLLDIDWNLLYYYLFIFSHHLLVFLYFLD